MLVTPDYRSYKHKSGKNLVIVEVQPEQVVPCNENDVIDDLGKGEPKEVFLGHFRRYLKKGIHDAAPFKKIEFAAPISDSGFTETPLRLSKDDNLTIVLPSPGISVRFDSVEADFVLFFSKIITSRYDGENGGIDLFNGQADAGEASLLYHDAFYAIWDNRACKVMFYGGIRVQNGFFPAMTGKTWKTCTGYLGEFIMKHSFLRKK